MKAKKRVRRSGPNLSWFRKRSDAVAAVVLPLFISATLYPSVAAAQATHHSDADLLSASEARDALVHEPELAAPSGEPRPAASLLESPAPNPTYSRQSLPGSARTQRAVLPEATTSSASGAGTSTGAPARPTTPGPSTGGSGEISAQAISLPSGAGTMGGMGESFSAQLTTGVALFSMPVALPAGRAALTPALSLTYSSSGGYGVAGVGWGLAGALAIARQSDRGIPRYDDRADWHAEQDRFTFGGQELVPVCKVASGACGGARPGEAMPPWSDGWQYFRPRVEGAFLRFFWSPDHLTWRIQSKSGMSFELGVPLDGSDYTGALDRNPSSPDEIYRWQVVRQYDAHGNPDATPPAPTNLIVFRYLQDGNLSSLSDIYYTPPANEPGTSDLSKYAHHVAIRYEDRPDRSASYRSGWLIEQRIRLAGLDVTSKPFQGAASSPRELVRRFHLGYAPDTHASLLSTFAVEGRCASAVVEDESGQLPPTSCPRLPPFSLEYQRVGGDTASIKDSQGLEFERFSSTLRQVDASPPHTLGSTESLSGLIDVNSDGLPDVVVTSPNAFGGSHGVYFNRGESGGKLRFAPVERMAINGVGGVDASLLNLGNSNVGVLDLDGNGTADLVHMPMVKRYSVFTPEKQGSAWVWQGRSINTASGQDVKINFAQDARRTAVMDVNGDGLVDVVVASATEYQTFFALGRYPGGDGQFGQAHWTGSDTAQLSNDPVTTCMPWSAEGARLGDSDVHVGDLNGDGLPDLVRLRSGQILYWPGRGNGFWGTGERDACKAGTLGQSQHIEMANAPHYGTAEPGTLELADVNGDGLADVVEIRADAVDVYLNENGLGFTERVTLGDVPFRPNNSNPVRLTDINGSGSADLLWGTGREYRYIDLTDGIRPYLLTKIHNGLGKTTELDYRSSAALMVDAADTGEPWSSVAPLSTPVVVRTIVRDNLERVGRAGGSYVTEYTYRDPVFEGRQREFRGFRSAETRQLGDTHSPTSITRSTHLLGECDAAQNDLDGCSLAERWRDNWREPLKGLPVLSETLDEHGVYLATEHKSYELRQLYTGRDGRRVSVAVPVGQQAFRYDTVAFDGSASTVSLDELTVNLDGVQQSEARPITRRASQGTVRTESTSEQDDFGNITTTTSFGCVDGCDTADEAIISQTTTERVPGDTSGWLFRPTESLVRGSVHTAARHQARKEYDARGDLTRSFATLTGTLPLDRFHESNAAIAPAPPDASGGIGASVEIETSFFEHDDFGNVIAARAPVNDCRSVSFADDYADLPIVETTFGGNVAADGCGERAFVTRASYDRGLSLVLTNTSITGQPSLYEYDSFGRIVAETNADPANPGQLASLPSATYEYVVPKDWTVAPYTVLVTRTQDGATPNDPEYHETFQYGDGLGRGIVALSEADPTAGDGGGFVAGGETDYTSKGEALHVFESHFWSGDPAAYPLGAVLPLQSTSQAYDAFGRVAEAYGLDGRIKLANKYHALSADRWDAGDLTPGPHQGSFGTVRADGHGRQVEAIERLHAGDVLEERRQLSEYLPTGELLRVIQRRAGSADVVRWLRYDSLGRLVLNVEPNTSVGFNADPDTNPSSLKALRYAYNDAGELVGTSDARGCGVNYYYDSAGRLVAEDYSPCLDSQAAYSAPDFSARTGIEVLYRYDVADPDIGTIADAAGRTLDVDTALLWGRFTSASDLGQKSVFSYDALGRPKGHARRMVKPGVPSAALADRYAPRWYVQETELDAADRPRQVSTGASSSALTGTDGRSVLESEYTARGLVKRTTSSYGTLLQSRTTDANGLVRDMTFGDAAATTRTYGYDENHRLASVQTYRGTPAVWSNPSLGTPASAEPTQQLLLEDHDLIYDAADNITEIRDYRIPEDWPAAAKPVTRKFEYDDLYRLTRASYEYAGGADAWKSPFAAENAGLSTVAGEPKPSPHTDFAQRVLEQQYEYDYLGNTQQTSDDGQGFFDRSLGAVENGAANAGPHQLQSASNRSLAPSSSRKGDLDAGYDASGNLTNLIVRRDGPCLPQGSSCWQRFNYEWDELGRLGHARRWDLAAAAPNERAAYGDLTDPLPSRAPDAELRYAYDAGGQRVLKTAVDPASNERHTVYVFGTLELRRSGFEGGDYELTATTENVLLGGGVSARVVYSEEDLPSLTSGGRHVFLEVSDHLGSNSFVIDHATGELVENATYQAYGSTESNYRPERWGSFREPVKFSGKEEDVEVGLAYFGARYLSLGLGRWMSPDLVTLHDLKGDPNPYAYAHGRPIVAIDPDGNFAFLAVFLISIIVSVVVNVAVQSNDVGFENISWGGVASAAVAGAAGSVVGGPLGSLVGTALAPALGAVGAGILGAGLGSAAGSGAAYLAGTGTNNALARAGVSGMHPQSLTWRGAGSAVGYGALGGAVSYGVGGALANSGAGQKLTSALTNAFGQRAGGAVAAGIYGAAGGLASGAAVAGASGGKFSTGTAFMSAAVAGVAAGASAAAMSSPRTDPTKGQLSGKGEKPGEYLAGKAPKQVTPGTKTLEGQYVNDRGRVEPWKAHYDEYGRQVGRTDYNAGNITQGIPDTHYHTYDWTNPGEAGREVQQHVPGEYDPYQKYK